MLQIEVKPYASDALEDAMRLAQVKAMNSYTFSDCFNYLNYTWSEVYNRMACIDSGYYSQNIRLTKRITRLPPFINNTVLVYRAARPTDRRLVYKAAGNNDQVSSGTYRISGTEIFCPDAESCTIWMEFVPNAPQLFFTMYNRDPKIWISHDVVVKKNWGIFKLQGDGTDDWTAEQIPEIKQWTLASKADITGASDIDLNEYIVTAIPGEHWEICYISCDFPYIFMSFRHVLTQEHYSGFFTRDFEWVEYNPFAFTGKNSNVEYIDCTWNDKTGMGVIVRDWNDIENDLPKIKELGWTPDTLLTYPNPCVYRYIVARLAEKFSVMNESNVMGVQSELVNARREFEAFVEKDKGSFKRINIVTGPTIEDWI